MRVATPPALAFTRPHTVLGTLLSTGALCSGSPVLPYAATATLASNVFIVGLNQLTDIQIDAINKPELPLPSGTMSVVEAIAITKAALVVAVVASLLSRSLWLVATTVVSCAVGTAYSAPCVRLKRNPCAAAACIVAVRGVVANVGLALAGGRPLRHVGALCAYFSCFAAAIAVLKDVPDTKGDAAHGVSTAALALGRSAAVGLATAFVCAALAAVAAGGSLVLRSGAAIAFLHFVPLALVTAVCGSTDRGVKRLYMRLWSLFYASYGAVWVVGAR